MVEHSPKTLARKENKPPVSLIPVSPTPGSRQHPARCETAEQFSPLRQRRYTRGFPIRQCVPCLFPGHREPRALAKARD